MWWLRALGHLPFWSGYIFASLLAFLAWRVFPYRAHVVRENLEKCFPGMGESALRKCMRDYYRGFADVVVEVVKSAAVPGAEIGRRVAFEGIEPVRASLASGKSVLLLAAHQCNWEWMLQKTALDLGFPLDAAYKPLKNRFGDREMLRVRSRFGARLVPAQNLLNDMLRRGRVTRAIAMIADQEPKTAERNYWTRFLNRDTAFYLGPEEIARVTHLPVFFVGMRRVARGYYRLEFEPLTNGAERLPPGELTERYARALEAQIRNAPPDWPWSHKRWKLKRSMYGKK